MFLCFLPPSWEAIFLPAKINEKIRGLFRKPYYINFIKPRKSPFPDPGSQKTPSELSRLDIIKNTNTMETQIKDIKSLDAEQYENLINSMFKLTHADAEEIGDPALEDTASYLRLALEAYQNRQSN